MKNKENNPFDIILSVTPNFSEEEAINIAKQHYNLVVSAENLVSERDQNFLLRTNKQKKYVLKIANSEENRIVTDFQICALMHINNTNDDRISVPEIKFTNKNKNSVILSKENKTFVTRVVSYLDGEPLFTSDQSIPDIPIAEDMGRYLAILGKNLADFQHPGSDQNLLWDMKRALSIREITSHIDSFSARRMVEKTLSDFERYALPKFDSIRWQVIHNDMNPDNVLLDTSRKRRVCGMIDFGDMVYSPLIIDLAVATAYLHTDEGNPMLLMNHFVAGYNQETPLLLEELDILFDLIKTRIATTVAVLEWRKSFRDKDDPYLELNSNDRSKNLLERCMEIPRDHAIQTFKQICAKP